MPELEHPESRSIAENSKKERKLSVSVLLPIRTNNKYSLLEPFKAGFRRSKGNRKMHNNLLGLART